MSDATPQHYPVLTPFKLQRAIVKPPARVPMTAEQARPYQVAGVLGEAIAAPAAGTDPATPAKPAATADKPAGKPARKAAARKKVSP